MTLFFYINDIASKQKLNNLKIIRKVMKFHFNFFFCMQESCVGEIRNF